MTESLDGIAIIDADTHIQEPPDLWTSRVGNSMKGKLPRVRWSETDGCEWWFLGDRKLLPVGATAFAGWGSYPPDGPRRFDEV